MEPMIVLVGLVFLAMWAILLRSKHERFGSIVFMIRSNYGVKLIESVALAKPRLWDFLADFSVLLSFGGLGGYYLSSHRESRDNLYRSVLLSGVVFSAIAAYLGKYEVAIAFFCLSALLSYLMHRVGSTLVDFWLSTVLFLCAAAMVFGASGSGSAVTAVASILCGVFGLPAVMIYILSSHGLNILSAQTNVPGVSPMLPAAKGGNVGVTFPGYDLFIPWWHVLVALFITLVVHEGAHGVLIRVAKVRLKSTGILSVFSFPIGAFVEPDEVELNRRTSLQRMRVFTVGSFANLVTGAAAAILIVLIVNLTANLVYSDGMRIVGFMDGYPAKGAIPPDTVIYSVDGRPTTNLTEFKAITTSMPPGTVVALNTSNGAYMLTLAAKSDEPGKGYLGVYLMENPHMGGFLEGLIGMGALVFVLEMLEWIAFFNINIALVNILPLVPFDGGRMFKEVVLTMRMSKVNVTRVLYATIAFMAVLFIVNMLPLLRMLVEFVFNVV